MDYRFTRLYEEFLCLLNDDPDFAEMYEDSEEGFNAWCKDYELN